MPTLLLALTAEAGTFWVRANDVFVREAPDFTAKVRGVLLYGAEVSSEVDTPGVKGFCAVEGAGQRGFVECRHLSAQFIPWPRAGEAGVDAARRWVNASSVTLRDAPGPDALILERLGLNVGVTLVREVSGTSPSGADGGAEHGLRWVNANSITLREAPRADAGVLNRMVLNDIAMLTGPETDGGYCAVKRPSGESGYVACQFLGTKPPPHSGSVEDFHSCEVKMPSGVRGFVSCQFLATTPSKVTHLPSYLADEPERAFWAEPSWPALYAYATHLTQLNSVIWPENPALERMKAHMMMVSRRKGASPKPYTDWQKLKHMAEGSAGRHEELRLALGFWDDREDTAGDGRSNGLVRALNFPEVRPSFFRTESVLAAPHETAEQVSGRFGILYRDEVVPRSRATEKDPAGAGLYDMLAVEQLLVRPVKRVQLFRDGHIRLESSVLNKRQYLWSPPNEPHGCEDYVSGFAFGAADPGLLSSAQVTPIHPTGSLFAVYMAGDLPFDNAIVTEKQVTLDEQKTGFVRGTYFYFDINHDDVPDIALWEGEGKGPGHLEGPTTTDDPWYRLALVNIAGAWKVLGVDTFGYGCGC